MNYDIYISYKRKSINLANNLYYRLTKRGYRVFFDLDEMRRDRFDEQLYNHIRNAKDLIVVLEEGSLKAIDDGTYLDDWFCKELMFAIKENKNIIPLLIEGYQMPKASYFPDELKELSYKNALLFGGLSYFEEYIDKLESQGYLTSKPIDSDKEHSVFKFYSEEDCKIYADGKLIGDITGKAEEPFYFFVKRKGKYRFKANNNFTGAEIVTTEQIDNDAEEIVDFKWPERELISPETVKEQPTNPTDEKVTVKLGEFSFNMIRVEGGSITIGATDEQQQFADDIEYPAHSIQVKTFYISEFPVTQNLYKLTYWLN